MRWTLAKKFFMISVFFIGFSFLLTFFIGHYNTKKYLLSSHISIMNSVCSNTSAVFSGQIKFPDADTDTSELQNLLTLMIRPYSGCTLWVIDTQGNILCSTDGIGKIRVPFNAALEGSYFRGTYNKYFNQDTISVYSPVIAANSYQPVGYLLLHSSYSAILKEANHALSRLYFLWAVFALLWCFFAFILYLILSSPLRRMLKTAQENTIDKSAADFDIMTSDEIGALSSILNRAFDRLRAVNDEERQFISNVSHDLRSPLTSIKGYLEAIQDGTIPPEKQGKYLTIVLAETDRLTELAQSLLTLNSLAYNKNQLERTNFDINRVIRQILLTFEQRCKKQGIRFHLIFCEKSQPVRADLAKIQQVLYNLIDNAIKFSPPDSVIEISTAEKYGKVLISIHDHGIGIPKESIPKIWNRFYKSDISRGKDKKGTGLGLSIVHDIINLHEETIYVNSIEGEGSEFVFSLPSAEK